MDLERYQSETHTRSFRIDSNRAVDADSRRVSLAFSSEEPYLRFFGYEVLDHSPESVRLDRLANGAPLLVDHDTRDHVGVVESVTIDGDRVGRAVVRFGKGQRATEIFEDVKDGIRSQVSVGYRVHHMILEKSGDESDPTYRVDDWEPHEISIVAVPADQTVGVGRDLGENTMETETQTRSQRRREAASAEQERERAADIAAIAEQFDMADLGADAIKRGDSVDAFRKVVMENMSRAAANEANHVPSINIPDVSGGGDTSTYGRALEGYDFMAALRGLAGFATREDQHAIGLAHEISDDICQATGKRTQGLMVPFEVMGRDLTYAGSGSNLVGTDHMASRFIETLRNQSSVMQANPTIMQGLQGNVSIPRQVGATTGYWFSGDGSDTITESDTSFDSVTLSPTSLGALTEVSRRVLMQSSPDAQSITQRDMANVLALAIDLAALNGSGSSNQPRGILNTTGINAATYTNGSTPSFEDIVNLETLVADDNADSGSLAYITTPVLRGALKTTDVGTDTGEFVWANDRMNGFQALASKQVPAGTVVFGNFADVLVGFWNQLELMVDPYSKFSSGTVAFRAIADCDIAIRQPVSFAALTEAA